jgi:hypothetical protein
MKQMSRIIVCLCLFALFKNFAVAQKVALISKDYKKPIIYTDSVTVEQVHSGYFPIEVASIDTFFANIKYVKEMLEVRQRSKMESFELRAGLSSLNVKRIPFGYGDRYSVTANNKLNEIEAVMQLVSQNLLNKKSAEKLKELLNYLSRNKSLFKSPYQITPKIYNAVVITEH